MLKRECLEHVGLFDEAIAFGVDYDLNPKCPWLCG
jgi:hypothetical protein